MKKRTWLAALRKEKRLKQNDVAAFCGMTQSSYSKIEIGERDPSVSAAKEIANLFDFSWTKFFH